MELLLKDANLAIATGLLFSEKSLWFFGDDKEMRIKWFILNVKLAINNQRDKEEIENKVKEVLQFGSDIKNSVLIIMATQPCINETSSPVDERLKIGAKRVDKHIHKLYKTLFTFTQECQSTTLSELLEWWKFEKATS